MDINYVIFTHLPDTGNAWRQFEKYANDVGKILATARTSGMLMMFIEPGWLQLLNIIGQDFDPVSLSSDFNEIERRETQFEHIIRTNKDLKGRARLITAKTLYPILNNIRGNRSGDTSLNLRKYLVADNPGVRYDTTKVVEAIIRIRHLGTGIPVIRMDWDALFNPYTLQRDLPLVTRDIPDTCEALAKDHHIYSYMISGSYETPRQPHSQWSINDFNTAFATRMFPALIPTRQVLNVLNNKLVCSKKGNKLLSSKDGDLTQLELTNLSSAGLFDRDVMENYYGISTSGGGISSMGSKPNDSVISGAALVLSDGAILDLPPFSNFRWNVMWIDDYLKYELHKALGHFQGKFGNPPIVPGRVDEHVFKDRLLAGQGNLRPYTLGVYIPVLFFGIIVDSWIRTDQGKTPFVKTLEHSLRSGSFSQRDRADLESELKKLAIERINYVISEWRKLNTDTCKSFAALWVYSNRSELDNVMSGILPPPDDRWLGWGLLRTSSNTISTLDQLNPAVHKCIIELIEDMCNYVDWTLYWPNFVQSVRAVKSGSIPLDVRFS